LSLIYICLKNKLMFWVPDCNGGMFYIMTLKDVSIKKAKISSNNFSLKKTIWYFVIMFALL